MGGNTRRRVDQLADNVARAAVGTATVGISEVMRRQGEKAKAAADEANRIAAETLKAEKLEQERLRKLQEEELAKQKEEADKLAVETNRRLAAETLESTERKTRMGRGRGGLLYGDPKGVSKLGG